MHIRRHHLRFIGVFIVLIICLAVFSVKLILIQVFQSDHLSALARKQHNHVVEIEPVRGTIYDRNHRPLAFNIPVYSLYANPRAMTPREKRLAARRLAEIVETSPEALARKLQKDKYFVWLKRKLSRDTKEAVDRLGLKGIGFRKESKRYYPNGALAAHVIGFAGMDNRGLEGIELAHDAELRGKAGKKRILRDARRRELMLGDEVIPPRDGFHLVLTLDETIQYLVERALQEAWQKYHAKSAGMIVMDTRTGEILAMANRPTYDLMNAQASPVANRTNRVISYVYEPGSVFKIVTAAAALEEDAFREDEKIFCENGRYKVGSHILNDHKPYGELTFREVIEKSSNIGTVKVAQALGAEKIYKYGRRFRFGLRTGIDLRGEVAGSLKPPQRWSKVSISAIPMGHEVTVTPLQMLCALTAVANDGLYMRPFVVKEILDRKGETVRVFHPRVVDRVVSPQTARRLTRILTGVVEHGTGRRAKIDGVPVAGKTGTAQKVVDGRYSHTAFYATFMGFAPADNPRLAAIVVLEEPRPQYYGGTVAAPVFQKVMADALKYLRVKESERPLVGVGDHRRSGEFSP